MSPVLSPLSRGPRIVHTAPMNIPAFINRSERRAVSPPTSTRLSEVLIREKPHKTEQLTSARLSIGWKAPSFKRRIADLHKSNWGSTRGKFSQMELSDVAVDCAPLTAVSRRNGTLEGTSGAKCRCTQPSHRGDALQRAHICIINSLKCDAHFCANWIWHLRFMVYVWGY